jgi:hypothetical protein
MEVTVSARADEVRALTTVALQNGFERYPTVG